MPCLLKLKDPSLEGTDPKVRVTTLIPGLLRDPDALKRTNIRVSYNGERPSALTAKASALLFREDFHKRSQHRLAPTAGSLERSRPLLFPIVRFFVMDLLKSMNAL